jgi:subtilisin
MIRPPSAAGGGRKTPPSHLVIFKHSDDTDAKAARVIKTTRRFLGAPRKGHTALKSAVAHFAPASNELQDERIYPRLGIAALHLEAEHVKAFKRNRDVLEVVENGTRHALGTLERRLTSEEAQTVHAAGGTNDPVRPFAGSIDPVRPFDATDEPVLPIDPGGEPVTPFGGTNDPVRPFGGSNDPTRPFSSGIGLGLDYDLAQGAIGAYLLGRRDEVEGILHRVAGSGSGDAPGLRGRIVRSEGRSWCLDMVGINAGYTRATGKGIKVAVLDTGLDLKHPDFRRRVSPLNCLNLINRGSTVQDGNGHGTHCCGIVAGKAEPQCKIRYGVAPDVTLLVGKVLDDQGDGKDSDILDGIAWAAEQGARVISLSLGSVRGLNERFSPAYATVARRLLKPPLNCVMVAATGNLSRRPHYRAPVANPAACPWILSVAAVGPDGRIADFSCAQVDKVGLVSLAAPGIRVLSSYLGGEYAELNGTSMSTAHVAGLAALHLELNPDWSAQYFWPMLIRCGLPLGASSDFGYGLGRAP